MKKYVLASAAAAALSLALPAAASAQTGYIDETYVKFDSDFGDEDAGVFSGALLTPLGGLNLQFDAAIGGIEGETFGNGAIHLFHRNDTFAIGGVVGVADAEDSDEVYSYGLEGAFYLEPVTISASVNELETDETGFEATVMEAGVRFFASDNFSVGGSFGNVDIDGAGDADIWGVNAEYKFGEGNPLSVFAGFDSIDDLDTDVWSLGLRWNFGHETLKDRDRNGPSMGRNAVTRLIF